MSLPSWWGRDLPCGCVRGVKLCADAVSLWDVVADAHNQLVLAWLVRGSLLGLRACYDEALQSFDAHYVGVRDEAAVQGGAML